MEAGGRFPTGVRELCADSCSSATTCELDRPNRGALVCREAYFLCMLRTHAQQNSFHSSLGRKGGTRANCSIRLRQKQKQYLKEQ